MFSKTCEYGIRAAIFIAFQSYQDNRIGLKEIAKKSILRRLLQPKFFKSYRETILLNL